jgi:hypothetical protein
VTNLTLRQQIDNARILAADARRGALIAERQVDYLLHARRLCDHQFSPAAPGTEHEGPICELCGIYAIHASTKKIGKQYEIQS